MKVKVKIGKVKSTKKTLTAIYDPPSNKLLYCAVFCGITNIDGLTTNDILEKLREKEIKGYE